jgi:hypothetical protein
MKKPPTCSICSRPTPAGRGPSSKHLTPEELPEYSVEHLDYEIEMLVETMKAWDPNAPRTLRNALTEAFAVHLRNLIAFLHPGREQCGDVYAKDFFGSPQKWIKDLPPLASSLATARDRASKEIAHVTVDRTKGSAKGKGWNPEFIDAVMVPLRRFVELADGDRLHPDVKARVVKLTERPGPIVVLRSTNIATDADTAARTVPSTTPVHRPYALGKSGPPGTFRARVTWIEQERHAAHPSPLAIVRTGVA